MDPEDDMYDPDDFDSVADDYNSDGAADDDGAGDEYDNSADDSREQKSFTVLKEDDIRRRQEDDITRVSTLLSIPRDSACILLHRYKWNSDRAQDEWFANEGRVRNDVGLFEIDHDLPVVKSRRKSVARNLDKSLYSCGVCFESYGCDGVKTAGCGHPFCSECWGAYISTAISDGPGCLSLKCPTPSCRAAVGMDMVDALVSSDDDKEKYRRYLFRSYIEDNYKKPKWCPGPECECAVEYDVGSGTKNYDVTCVCSYSFCWNCRDQAHRPVDCDTVAKWVLKNSSESENTTWILANSKPCPKCKRAIEKNHGCMHMTCTAPCKFEFCWVCLEDWKAHGYNYACNRYDSSEPERKKARQFIIRYTHYYERWAANHSSREKALADLHRMQTEVIQKLGFKHDMSRAQVEFVVEAWQQIVECRRVLKWTYAYGYYIPEQEFAKRNLFEYLQGQAEAGLERLHLCAEKELQCYLSDKSPGDFIHFRTRLLNLTKVTGNYFDNLVRALENGLSETNTHSTSTSTSTRTRTRTRSRSSTTSAAAGSTSNRRKQHS